MCNDGQGNRPEAEYQEKEKGLEQIWLFTYVIE